MRNAQPAGSGRYLTWDVQVVEQEAMAFLKVAKTTVPAVPTVATNSKCLTGSLGWNCLRARNLSTWSRFDLKTAAKDFTGMQQASNFMPAKLWWLMFPRAWSELIRGLSCGRGGFGYSGPSLPCAV